METGFRKMSIRYRPGTVALRSPIPLAVYAEEDPEQLKRIFLKVHKRKRLTFIKLGSGNIPTKIFNMEKFNSKSKSNKIKIWLIKAREEKTGGGSVETLDKKDLVELFRKLIELKYYPVARVLTRLYSYDDISFTLPVEIEDFL